MLEIKNLTVRLSGHEIVNIGDLRIDPGERLGLVGESGSGKTITAMTIAGLQPPSAIVSGSVKLNGRELLGLSERESALYRGLDIGIVFQDPLRALNPVMRIGKQVAEAVRLHFPLSRGAVSRRVLDLLTQVQLRDPDTLVRRYPHQLSGGQRQRVLIAIAIASHPKLLVADEPTTALDVTVQSGILELLNRLSLEENMSLLFVSHDLGVIRAISDRVAVMYGGRIMEIGPTPSIINGSQHRYTQALVAANPGRPSTGYRPDHHRQPLVSIPGAVPPIGGFPSGCRFRGRCQFEIVSCSEVPEHTTVTAAGHRYACWNPVGGDRVASV